MFVGARVSTEAELSPFCGLLEARSSGLDRSGVLRFARGVGPSSEAEILVHVEARRGASWLGLQSLLGRGP